MLTTHIGAYGLNIRQSTNADGLSNSAILSLDTDADGLLWIGTCDGVNIADGITITPFSAMFPGLSLSGNIIEQICASPDQGVIWVLTNYGLDMVDKCEGSVRHFTQFHGQELICVDQTQQGLYIANENGDIECFNGQEFNNLTNVKYPTRSIKAMGVRERRLWVATNAGVTCHDADSACTRHTVFEAELLFAKFLSDEDLYVISRNDSRLLKIDTNGRATTVCDLTDEICRHGSVSDIVVDKLGNIFVAFHTDGVVRIATDGTHYDLGLRTGVFALKTSPTQPVVWVGSDCQGLYTLWQGVQSVRSYDYSRIGSRLSRPIRAVMTDDAGNLWLGTKGDGLLRAEGFSQHSPSESLRKTSLYTSSNSDLLHNSVFAFSQSTHNLMWIGTEEGLNYFSYRDNKIHRLHAKEPVRFVHAVEEVNDTTLLLATLGLGIVKVTLYSGEVWPKVKSVKYITLEGGNFSSNFFFSLYITASGRVLACNRGEGLFELSGDTLRSIPLERDYDNRTVFDVFTAAAHGDCIWRGTGCGLIETSPKGEILLGAEDGVLSNSTVHHILRDASTGDIWLSTNKGLVRYDPGTGESQTYGRNFGLSVTEYSDGAAFALSDGSMIFGGINGITIVSRDPVALSEEVNYHSPIFLTRLTIGGKGVMLNERAKVGDDGTLSLFLRASETHFTVNLCAPDFIGGDDYIFYYSLDGHKWINNGHSATIQFSGIDYGDYTLRVKYLNQANGEESPVSRFNLHIAAPWYLTVWAKAGYIMIFMLICGGVGLYFIQRQRQKQSRRLELLEQTHKEEVYEEKLRFFTNITHEFCTPLTLIHGPCERVLTYSGSDDYIRRYVGLVKTNAERLNALIQELIDFRRTETGHRDITIRPTDITQLCTDTAASFSELTERNAITFDLSVSDGLTWPTDFSCLRKIIVNLVSNAFKYTSAGGVIRLKAEANTDDDTLIISVYNTGKGIRPSDMEKLFNRYSILDNVEENAIKGLSSRNGLGLAICHSMAELLKGKIEIVSTPGEFAEFIVVLPRLPQSAQSAESTGRELSAVPCESAHNESSPIHSANGGPTLLVIDDNTEILTLLHDMLTDYNVQTATTAEDALDMLKQSQPELIVSDIMLPGMTGLEFVSAVKANRHTMHIPVVLLSAKNSDVEKVEGVNAGADAYIGKPFSLSYLRAVIERLLQNREHLRQYYNSAAAAFSYSGGQLLHSDDRDFMAKVADIIASHIDDAALSAELIAESLGISVRNLYRKFKDIDQTTPNDFIKSQRMAHAAKLLLTTSLSVQEIIYSCGFSNRSHFYKEFDKRFGMTPKDYRQAHVHKDPSLEVKTQ